MVLAAIVIVGILIEAAHETTWHIIQADREAELLFRGDAYRRAIESFYKSNGSYPRALEDLVKDPRSSNKRHLRTLYRDPMSKEEKAEWTLVLAADGGITGVASRSKEQPLRQANFKKEYEKFVGAKAYADWLFEYKAAAAPVLPRQPVSTPVGPQPTRTF